MTEDEALKSFTDIKKLVEASGATIKNESSPALLNLAYQMELTVDAVRSKYNQAYFAWIILEADGTQILSVTEGVKERTDILRHLLITTKNDSPITSEAVKQALSDDVEEDNSSEDSEGSNKSDESDSEKFEQTIARNLPTMYRTREIIRDLSINMKLSDVEFQADNTKATFYYSADERVDFRELIKLLASEFKIRVEMKQISLRQEASRLGGIGVCGRELCWSTWLTDFKSVSTAAARYQNLSLNPSKLSGQCGRLKCCLNYELETYMEALEYIPTVSKPLNTLKGKAILQKTDIFRQMMWFGYYGETTWHPITIDRVNKIMEMNQEGQTPDTLQEDKIEVKSVKNTPVLESMANKMSNRKETTDLDNKKSKSKNRNKKRKKRSNNTGTSGRTNSNNSGDLPK
jgi:cell fate regulator YaaT (PSP1 superfamily)